MHPIAPRMQPTGSQILESASSGDRQQQRGDRRDQRIAHRQRDVERSGLARAQPVACHAQHQTGDDVDEQDQQRGDRIALHELAGTIHRPVEIGLGRDLAAACLGFLGGHQPCGEVGIDRHLLARQGVEGEARGHFGHAARTLGHHHHVDDRQDDEHDQPDREIAADQEFAEGLDHLARRRAALVPVEQYDAGRCDVQCEAHQRGEQQDRGEGREVERLLRIHRRHQDRDRQRDIEHEEQVEHQRRDRHDHKQDDRENPGGKRKRGRDEGRQLHRPSAANLE